MVFISLSQKYEVFGYIVLTWSLHFGNPENSTELGIAVGTIFPTPSLLQKTNPTPQPC